MCDIFGEGADYNCTPKVRDIGLSSTEIEYLTEFSCAVSVWTNDWEHSASGTDWEDDA